MIGYIIKSVGGASLDGVIGSPRLSYSGEQSITKIELDVPGLSSMSVLELTQQAEKMGVVLSEEITAAELIEAIKSAFKTRDEARNHVGDNLETWNGPAPDWINLPLPEE